MKPLDRRFAGADSGGSDFVIDSKPSTFTLLRSSIGSSGLPARKRFRR